MISQGIINAEAKGIARRIVRHAIRQAGTKASQVDFKMITKAADKFLEANPQIYKLAEYNLFVPEIIAGWADWSKYAATGEWR